MESLINDLSLEGLEGYLSNAMGYIDFILMNEEFVKEQTLQQPGPYINPCANRLDEIKGEIQQAWIHVGRLRKRVSTNAS